MRCSTWTPIPPAESSAEELGAGACTLAELEPQARRYAITVNASADASGGALRACLLATEPDGVCVNTSLHFTDPEMPLLHMFLNCLTLTGGLSHARANMPAVLRLITGARITPGRVVTDVLEFDTAAQAIAGAASSRCSCASRSPRPPSVSGATLT